MYFKPLKNQYSVQKILKVQKKTEISKVSHHLSILEALANYFFEEEKNNKVQI